MEARRTVFNPEDEDEDEGVAALADSLQAVAIAPPRAAAPPPPPDGASGNWFARVPALAPRPLPRVLPQPQPAAAAAHFHAPLLRAAGAAAAAPPQTFASAVEAALLTGGRRVELEKLAMDPAVKATRPAGVSFKDALGRLPRVSLERLSRTSWVAVLNDADPAAVAAAAGAPALPRQADDLHAALRRFVAPFGAAGAAAAGPLGSAFPAARWGYESGALHRECVAAGLEIIVGPSGQWAARTPAGSAAAHVHMHAPQPPPRPRPLPQPQLAALPLAPRPLPQPQLAAPPHAPRPLPQPQLAARLPASAAVGVASPRQADLHASLRHFVAAFGAAGVRAQGTLGPAFSAERWGIVPGTLRLECIAAGLEVASAENGDWAARLPRAAAAEAAAHVPARAPVPAAAAAAAAPAGFAFEAFSEAVRATLRDGGGRLSISFVQADPRVKVTKAAAGAGGHGNFRPALDRVLGVRTQAGENEADVVLESMAPPFALPSRAELHAALRRCVARFGAAGRSLSVMGTHFNARDWGFAPGAGALLRECVAAGLSVFELPSGGGMAVRSR